MNAPLPFAIASEATLAVGDLVRLKSGGPEMVVTGKDLPTVRCAWFVNGTACEKWFPPEALMKRIETP